VVTDDGTDPARAAALARGCDVAVLVAGDAEHEGGDRADLNLPSGQDALIAAVAAANPRTVVVLHTGAPVAMPWLDRVHSLVQAWYPGEEDGDALADVLFGDVDPSGRLPVTFPRAADQSPATGAPRYPAGPGGYEYTEGLDVGYRGFDAAGLVPLFPFGYGLSYTTFTYTGLRVVPDGGGVRVRFTVTDTGGRAGVAVPQVYLGFPGAAGEPPHQLKGFDRVALAPGAARDVTLTLPAAAFTTWSAAAGWHTVHGDYQISVGSSSRDLPLHAAIRWP
jgi:beta-glucosidase